MDKIYMNGLEFYGFHGVFEEETRLGQRFYTDAVMGVALQKAGETDDLARTVNTGEGPMSGVAVEIVRGRK